jgi:exonuclease SbcC
LGEGETLEKFIANKFETVQQNMRGLEAESQNIAEKLKAARSAEQLLIEVGTLTKRNEDIESEGHRLRAEMETIGKKIEQLTAAETELADVTAKLEKLDDPRSKIKILRADLDKESDATRETDRLRTELERLETERNSVSEKIALYAELDAELEKVSAERAATEDAFRKFMANESAAAHAAERKDAADKAAAELVELTERAKTAEAEAEKAAAAYDAEKHTAERAEMLVLQRSEAEIAATLKAHETRRAELDAEIEKLNETRREMHGDMIEKERHEKVLETTEFIRDTLKEAAPLVARNYVYRVSAEANQMFREITGDPERTLKWGEDYDISLEEGGYERPFIGLSGGEQMAAALSVRLALLKQMTDIRIAFFDEPTTNMDAERRQNLAEQISRIGHFDQLFIISHDDTFEEYVDNTIVVEKARQTAS